jgi:hypothetical protein
MSIASQAFRTIITGEEAYGVFRSEAEESAASGLLAAQVLPSHLKRSALDGLAVQYGLERTLIEAYTALLGRVREVEHDMMARLMDEYDVALALVVIAHTVRQGIPAETVQVDVDAARVPGAYGRPAATTRISLRDGEVIVERGRARQCGGGSGLFVMVKPVGSLPRAVREQVLAVKQKFAS